MTIPRIMALNRHWEYMPPVHKNVARLCSAYLKEKTERKTQASDNKKGDLQELIAAFGAAGGQVKI